MVPGINDWDGYMCCLCFTQSMNLKMRGATQDSLSLLSSDSNARLHPGLSSSQRRMTAKEGKSRSTDKNTSHGHALSTSGRRHPPGVARRRNRETHNRELHTFRISHFLSRVLIHKYLVNWLSLSFRCIKFCNKEKEHDKMSTH